MGNKEEKEERRGTNIVTIIDWVLITILIITVIIAQVNGKYINKEIIEIETCNGAPTPEGLMTLEELGLIQRDNTTAIWEETTIGDENE